MAKNLPANAGDVGSISGSGRSPGGGTGSHSSILAWGVLWTEEPSRLQSMGPKGQTRLCNLNDDNSIQPVVFLLLSLRFSNF